MEPFDTVFDQVVMHQVRLMQLSISYQKETQFEIDDVEDEVAGHISTMAAAITAAGGYRVDDPIIKAQIDNAVQELWSIRRSGYLVAFEKLKSRMAELFSYETSFTTAMMRPYRRLNVPRISGNETTEVMGHSLTAWQERLHRNDTQRLSEALRLGARIGATEAQLRASLFGHSSYKGADGLTATSRNELDTLVRTATDAFSDAARVNINMENALQGKEVYVAILDNRTTDVCRDLHATVFDVDRGARPPVHWYCRSVRVPLVGGVSKPNIPTYGEWLKRVSKADRAEILGAAQAQQFDAGTLAISGFREPNWRGIDLRTMAQREARVFEEAGMDVPFQ